MAALFVAFPALAFANGEPAETRVVEARVARPDSVSPPVVGRVVASLVSGEAELVVSVLDADGVARFNLAPGTTWRVCVEAESLWSQCSILTVEPGLGPQIGEVQARAAASLTGRLKLGDAGETLPDRVSITVQTPVRPGRRQEIPETSRACERQGGDGFRCQVPAGELDVTVRAPSFVAHDFWSLSTSAGEERSLGTLALERGASLTGRVEVVDGEIAVGTCNARLKPFVGQGPGWREAERRAGSEASAIVHPTGAFRVGGVAPGTYVLIVDQDGFASARAFPIELARESETRLREPVILRRPLSLTFELSPPSDWLGQPWTLELHRQAEFSSGFEDEKPLRMRASAQGMVEIEDQAPGILAVQVFDSLGNPMFGDLSVPVRSPEEARQRIEIPVVLVEGRLRLGDEPMAARLWFGGRHGVQHAEMQADLEGSFSGALPRDGTWRVEIVPAGETDPLETRVEVAAGPDGVADLEVVLPDTEVFGRAVFENGTAAEGARIGLDVDGEGRTVRSDEKGEFSIRAVREGTGVIRGSLTRSGERWSSETTTVAVVEDSPHGPMEIVLRPSRAISGQVVSDGVPVPGAIVEARTAEPQTAGLSDHVRCDREGRFTLQVHPQATLLTVTVRPPGYALTTQYAIAEEPLVLNVPRHGGELVLTTAARSEDLEKRGLRLWLLQEGQILSWQALWEWARGHSVIWPTQGPTLRMPNLAPGHYEACLVGQEAAVRSQIEAGDWRPAASGCVDGYLQAGAVLELTTPPLPEPTEPPPTG